MDKFYELACLLRRMPVSYTHLDVYKRQVLGCAQLGQFFFAGGRISCNPVDWLATIGAKGVLRHV